MRYLEGYKAVFAEGPFWDEERQILLYVDLAQKAVVNHDILRDEAYSWQFDTPITAIMKSDAEHYIFVTNQKLIRFNYKTEQQEDYFVFHDLEHYHLLNDAKIDKDGNVWVGTVDDRFRAFKEHPETALSTYVETPSKLYKISPTKELFTFDFPITLSNGIAFNHERNVAYHVDSATQAVWALHLNHEGELIRREKLFQCPILWGFPDGITIDANGDIWVALFQSHFIHSQYKEQSKVVKVCGTSGRVLQTIALDVPHVTSCLVINDTLFVTTAAEIGETDAPLENGGKVLIVDLANVAAL